MLTNDRRVLAPKEFKAATGITPPKPVETPLSEEPITVFEGELLGIEDPP